jgi:cytochrome c553
MVAFSVAAYAAKEFFTVDSFYRYGHYRGASVQEIAAIKPLYMGSAYCKSCHAERYAEWSKGVHHSPESGKVVQCEVCHGVAGGRDSGGKFEHASTGIDHPASGKLAIPADTRKLCPICHEKMAGRPAEQRQVVVETHAGTQQCTSCHNPHSPKLMKAIAGAQGAAGGPADKAAACAACHGSEGVSGNDAWPNLAGQHGAYLLETLKAYKAGTRDNAVMSAAAKALSDADMKELVDHFARLKANTPARNSAQTAAGKAQAAACAGCHGADGVSANPAWPILKGQQKGYLVAALKAYRDGSRKHELMAAVAKALSDADMELLATYYAGTGTR